MIVFDKNHRRFILLDLTRHVLSEVSTEDVRAFVDRVKQRLAGHPNPAIKWMVDPSFEENFDRDSEQLSLKSSAISYQARIQATVPVVAAQYHEFSDWYAQFNMVLNPSSRPPFARMMLNDAIERNKGIAREVHLTVALSSKDPPTKITSRHQLALQLDAADMNRIAEVRDDLRSFQSVSLRDYRQGK